MRNENSRKARAQGAGMSRPLKTPSMRWEFAFCSSGYVLVLLYTLGALGLNCEQNCERVREQRWRAFVTPPPRRERPSVSCSSRRRHLGPLARPQGGGCAAPRGAAPGRCGACAPEPPRSRRAIRARDPGAGASPPAAAVVVAGEWVGCGDRCGALRSMRSRVATRVYRVWLRRSRAGVASSRGPGV